MPVLIITHNNEEKAIELPEDRPVFIGRDVKCEIRLPENEISRIHAVIIYKNGLTAIKDLNSFSGTLLNGKPLTQPSAMSSGDSIVVGSYRIKLLKIHSLTSGTRVQPPQSRSTTQILGKDSDSFHADTSTGGSSASSDTQMRELMDAIEPQAKRADMGGSDTQMFTQIDTAQAKSAAPDSDTNFVEPDAFLEDHVFNDMPVSSPSGVDNEETSELGAMTTGMMETGGTRLVSRPGQTPYEEDNDADDGGNTTMSGHDETDSQSLEELVGSDEEDEEDQEEDDDLELEGESPPTIEDELDIQPEELEPVPLDSALREAIEARLKMYSLLSNLAEERRFFRTQGNLPEDVLMELGRQDREFYTLPQVDEVEKLLKERQQVMGVVGDLDDQVEAPEEDADRHLDKKKTKMRQAGDIALSQLMLISKYNSQVLPVVYRRAYSLAIEEPLSQELRVAKISHVGLIGGACYCLALEKMLEECKAERNALKTRMKNIQDGKADGKTAIGGFFDKLAKNLSTNKEDKAELARLNQNELQLANTAIWIGREIAFVEKSLISEFWRIYRAVVKHFIPQAATMPYSIRAFLRYGVIAFSPWWLSPRLAARIWAECTDSIVMEFTGNIDAETILHADEYLTAIWKMELGPIPNETVMLREKNSLRWKAERAYRRMVNGRQRMIVLREVLQQLADQDVPLETQLTEVDGQILELASTQGDGGSKTSSIQRERHNLEEKRDALARRGKYIENRYLKATREIVTESEERFQSGELTQPSVAEILDHECELIIETSRRLAGNRERFLPLFIRKHFKLDSDVTVNRDSIERFLVGVLEKDPALFRVKLIDSSRKENRLEIDLKPIFLIIPSSGVLTNCLIGRDGLENGRLALPTLFFRENLRDKQLMNLMADYRWECARALSGRDPMSSDTVTGAFMRVRWEWRRFPKTKRQKGLIFKEMSDKVNWRRVYETYMQDTLHGGRKLFSRNFECYARIFVKYFEPPDGVEFLKKKN